MATIPYASEKEAQDRSREMWEAILGRKKHPEDVTEFLFPVRVRVETTGDELADPNADLPDGVDVALVVPARDKYLDKLAREDRIATDEAAAVVDLYPAHEIGKDYAADDLVAYDGTLYKVTEPTKAKAGETPDKTAAKYAPVGDADAAIDAGAEEIRVK